MDKKTVIKIRFFLFLLLVCLVFWLLYLAVAPSGQISYQTNFQDNNYFIGPLTPKTRIKTNAQGRIEVIGDPVYFRLRTLRPFQKANLTLEYRPLNPKKTPIIEAGVLADKTVWRYDLQPLDNEIINNLASRWAVISDNSGDMLLQKEKKYFNIQDFLANLPPRDQITLYHYKLEKKFVLPDYASIEQKRIINYPLRGPYQFYTYIKDEPFDFNFVFKDLNQNKDKDPINIQLYYENELIDSRHLDDDGQASDSGVESLPRTASFYLSGLPEGLYKIEVRVNDDIVTQRIETKQSKLAFVNKIWLAEKEQNNIEVFTDTRQIQAKTTNPASLQTIWLGDDELVIDKTYKQFRAFVKPADDSNYAKIKLAKGGLVLTGDGVFAFWPQALINPAFKKVNLNFNAQRQKVNYILAHYQRPQIKPDGWRIARAEFDLTGAYREKNAYNFLISVPGLLAENSDGAGVEIKSARLDLSGRSLAEVIFETTQNLSFRPLKALLLNTYR